MAQHNSPSGKERQEQCGALPPRWLRGVVTLLLLAHWFAIATAVIAAGTPQFPPPLPAIWARLYVTQPYLNFVFLANPYRFYAPNPGPANLIWFRIEYEDGTVRWWETPERRDWTLRMPYQRHLCLALLFDQMAESAADDPTLRRLTLQGKVAASSFARYVARKFARSDAQGNPVPAVRISIYTVMHSVLEPWMVQQGWDIHDLRLYSPFYLGTYSADGLQLDAGTDTIQYRVISDMAAYILATDVYPLFRQHPQQDRSELLHALGAPRPIRALFYRFPELLQHEEMDRPDLKEVIERLHGTQGFPPERLQAPRG